MATSTLLDADMATIGRWIRRGFAWWIDELTDLVPARMRRGGGRPSARFDARRNVIDAPANAGAGGIVIAIPDELVLRRTIDRPNVSDRDAQAMVELEADRLFPLPGDEILVATRTVQRHATHMVLAVAMLRRTDAQRIAEAIAASGHEARAILPAAALDVDFLPAFRAAGLVTAPSRANAPWWALVAFLVVANIALMIWRDSTNLEAMRQLVDEQRPAVMIAERIAGRGNAMQATATRAVELRRRHDVLGWMDRVSRVAPQRGWLQSYAWTGEQLRITGLKQRDEDLVGALRAIPGLSSVRVTAVDTVTDLPAGQPFDITAKIRSR